MDYSKMSVGELEALYDDLMQAKDKTIQENDDEREFNLCKELDLIEEELDLRYSLMDD